MTDTAHRHNWGPAAELPRPNETDQRRYVFPCRGCDTVLIGNSPSHRTGHVLTPGKADPIVDLLMAKPPKAFRGFPAEGLMIRVRFEAGDDCYETWGWEVLQRDGGSFTNIIAAGANLEAVCAAARETIERQHALDVAEEDAKARATAEARAEVRSVLRVGDDLDEEPING